MRIIQIYKEFFFWHWTISRIYFCFEAISFESVDKIISMMLFILLCSKFIQIWRLQTKQKNAWFFSYSKLWSFWMSFEILNLFRVIVPFLLRMNKCVKASKTAVQQVDKIIKPRDIFEIWIIPWWIHFPFLTPFLFKVGKNIPNIYKVFDDSKKRKKKNKLSKCDLYSHK